MRYINSDLEGKKILITGGAGFIGSNLAFYFQENHPNTEVTIFDCFRSGKTWPSGSPTSLGDMRNLAGFRGKIIQGDINQSRDLLKIKYLKPDFIFHEAAISDTTVMDPAIMNQTNVNAYRDILYIAKELNSKLIYASSAGTYGNSAPPNRVGEGEQPTNVYGQSKLHMDEVTRKFLLDNPGMHVVGLRYFNVFGNREYLKGNTASMILQLGLQALRNKKVRLFKFGEQKRDFVFIEDVVQANLKALETTRPGIYNVGSGISRTFNDIVTCLKKDMGEFEVEYFDNSYSFYQNHTEADISETRQWLGYEPGFSLERGIETYLPEIKTIYEGKIYQ